jgi:hypothetical protein
VVLITTADRSDRFLSHAERRAEGGCLFVKECLAKGKKLVQWSPTANICCTNSPSAGHEKPDKGWMVQGLMALLHLR